LGDLIKLSTFLFFLKVREDDSDEDIGKFLINDLFGLRGEESEKGMMFSAWNSIEDDNFFFELDETSSIFSLGISFLRIMKIYLINLK
jgi:hypothetical protein